MCGNDEIETSLHTKSVNSKTKQCVKPEVKYSYVLSEFEAR